MKVTIVGAGIGGLALAREAIAAGHEVTVHEKADRLRTGGAALILWPNGTGILEHMGVRAATGDNRLDSFDTLFHDAALASRLRLSKIAEKTGSPAFGIPRGRLIAELADGLPPEIFRFGKECSGVESWGEGGTDPVVTFTDGTTAGGDVVVAADGHRSAIRRALVGDGLADAEHTGYATWYGMTKLVDHPWHNQVLGMHGPGGFCMLFPVDGLLMWVFAVPWQQGETAPPGAVGGVSRTRPDADGDPSPLENLRARFGDWAEPVPQVLANLSDDEIDMYPHVIHQVPQSWGRGKVTMLGDAVHAVPPTLGQGVNQTLEDVWSLGRLLADPKGREGTELLRAYEKARGAQVASFSKTARRLEGNTAPSPFMRHTKGKFPFTTFWFWWVKRLSNYLR
ncbi:NAD(P)/FAD-dependent oxidoreductase [Streptomyces sp. NPDC021969]|uniref:FAD-dependent oxidoreductase n=1 Tax=unclassified Streptomyces TaxID=2593676 RepID=UPI00340A7E45